MEAVGIHDFHANDAETELSFKKGDNLLLLNYGDPAQWYNAERNGHCGLVPGNYIEVKPASWYWGRISRVQAEQILSGNKYEGAFLVRLSESSPTDFSLSVKDVELVQHFRVLKDGEGKYSLWATRFNSLNELVEHYRTESVSSTKQLFLHDLYSDNQFVVIALYDFNPNSTKEDENELAFQEGDIITVFDDSDSNWWGGTLNKNSGFFPCSYVKRYKPSNIY